MPWYMQRDMQQILRESYLGTRNRAAKDNISNETPIISSDCFASPTIPTIISVVRRLEEWNDLAELWSQPEIYATL